MASVMYCQKFKHTLELYLYFKLSCVLVLLLSVHTDNVCPLYVFVTKDLCCGCTLAREMTWWGCSLKNKCEVITLVAVVTGKTDRRKEASV